MMSGSWWLMQGISSPHWRTDNILKTSSKSLNALQVSSIRFVEGHLSECTEQSLCGSKIEFCFFFLFPHLFNPFEPKWFHVQNSTPFAYLNRVLQQHFKNSNVLYKYKTLVFAVAFPAYHKYCQLHICTVNSPLSN